MCTKILLVMIVFLATYGCNGNGDDSDSLSYGDNSVHELIAQYEGMLACPEKERASREYLSGAISAAPVDPDVVNTAAELVVCGDVDLNRVDYGIIINESSSTVHGGLGINSDHSQQMSFFVSAYIDGENVSSDVLSARHLEIRPSEPAYIPIEIANPSAGSFEILFTLVHENAYETIDDLWNSLTYEFTFLSPEANTPVFGKSFYSGLPAIDDPGASYAVYHWKGGDLNEIDITLGAGLVGTHVGMVMVDAKNQVSIPLNCGGITDDLIVVETLGNQHTRVACTLTEVDYAYDLKSNVIVLFRNFLDSKNSVFVRAWDASAN